jgi:hypothetical protein
LAIGAIGLQWPLTPALLRNPLIEYVFVGAGALVLAFGFVTLALDLRTASPGRKRNRISSDAYSQSSLMTLPAIMVGEPAVSVPPRDFDRTESPPAPAPRMPVVTAGASADPPGGSTLLIPFSEAGPSLPASPPAAAPPDTVSRMVSRMDAVQRAAPALVPPAAPSPPSPASSNSDSSLLHRLTRIPTPPPIPSATAAPRRCTDCGDSLGSPPQFETCADCRRALCERCYWRTSTGPRAHFCTTCYRDRSVPRPPSPTATRVRPSSVSAVSVPVKRSLPPRQPAS